MTNETRTGEDPTDAILSESALNEKYLCDYVINVATGCRHGCRFCYVPGTPNIRTRGEMLKEEADVDDGQEEWGEYVLYRDDIPDRLPGILDRKRTWRETEKGQGIVGISFHTDCFMDKRAAEITTEVVRTLADHGKHARILTRNPMLASSYMEVFEGAGEYVTVGSSIPTLNEDYIDALEPNAPPVVSRLRGLERFADAGVPVYVSMSPTYPTIRSDGDMRRLMEHIASLDPSVVFHEPINPRGKNFEMTVAAAEEAGLDDLARELVEIQAPDAWLRYACTHFAWVQRIGRDLDLPVHLWPDKKLVELASYSERTWLQHWLDRQSPEPFAGRPTPDKPPMEWPPLFTWEEQQELVTDGGVEVEYNVPLSGRGSWYDVEWVQCDRCRGSGERVECFDDLCHAKGRCMHDPRNNVCKLCGGTGRITANLDELWFSRDAFESVIAPDADLRHQGKLHAVARRRHDREVQEDRS